jgi:hypothetical protein
VSAPNRYLEIAPVLVLWISLLLASAASSSVLSTTDPVQIVAFQAGRTVLGFDEIAVPTNPCFIELARDRYASSGIGISARADGSDTTHVARLPACGHFGATHTPPNIIGGGTAASSLGWRETVRFDFPHTATAIGAHTDASGSNTSLTAYRSDGSVIATVSGNQGTFLGISEPDIAYALWTWNFDQGVAGFSLDNVTFTAAEPVPVLPAWGTFMLATLLASAGAWHRTPRRRS